MILAVMSDLIFQVKIMDAAKRLGRDVRFVTDLPDPPPAVDLVLFDMGFQPTQQLERIARATEHGIRTVAFISHVQTDLRRLTEEAGCDAVVARSAFVSKLPELLRGP